MKIQTGALKILTKSTIKDLATAEKGKETTKKMKTALAFQNTEFFLYIYVFNL